MGKFLIKLAATAAIYATMAAGWVFAVNASSGLNEGINKKFK